MAVRIVLHQDPGAVLLERTPPCPEIAAEPARLEVRSRKPQVAVDRTDYWDAVSVRRPVELGAHLHELAVAAAIEAIGRISAEGDRLSQIENPNNTIAGVAEGEMAPDEVELTLRTAPPPVISVTPGGVEIEVTPGPLRIEWPEAPLRIEVRRAQVTVDTDVPPTVDRAA